MKSRQNVNISKIILRIRGINQKLKFQQTKVIIKILGLVVYCTKIERQESLLLIL